MTKKYIGYIAWIISFLTLIFTVKIKQQFIGEMLLPYFNLYIALLLFLISVFIFNSIFKNIKTVLINWLNLMISLGILVAFISIIINR